MSFIASKRLISSALALGIAASAFTVLPTTSASAAPWNSHDVANTASHPRYNQARQVSTDIPDITVKSGEYFTLDLGPYIHNADDFTVLINSLPYGVNYDHDTKTISGSTPFAQDYNVNVFLKGRRNKWLQSFTLTVEPSYSDPNDYPRNTDDPALNRLPHFRR
ncbi:hypothetical protein [Stomatohabitans albus]|uniref:hypothetical protein n=1 Tax=Stomatohabitans albus TaxID=3110766 RepID=UPI00300CC443